MERHGFIHDILDVKMLILFVMNLVEEPVSAQMIYELCYQDECLSYFDVQEAIPQMVQSGHLEEREKDNFFITEKGKEAEQITHNAIAFPVRHRAQLAAEQLNRNRKRDRFLRTKIIEQGENCYVVQMGFDDAAGPLMDLHITAPSLQQARRLERAYRKNAEIVYQSVMIGLLEELEDQEEEE